MSIFDRISPKRHSGLLAADGLDGADGGQSLDADAVADADGTVGRGRRSTLSVLGLALGFLGEMPLVAGLARVYLLHASYGSRRRS